MKGNTITVEAHSSIAIEGAGHYTITNHSSTNFVEIVGGVNSTMLFELGPLSKVRFHDYHGIKAFNNTDTATRLFVVYNAQEDKMGVFSGKTFCVDAGHGGSDPGAVNGDHQEKDTALRIAKKVQAMVEGYGGKVVMTRTNDTRPGNTLRATMANSAKCDAFISVHLNSADNKKATGIEVLVYRAASFAGTMANRVLERLMQVVTWPNRGVKERPDLTVLKKTTMPAILVEVGFISNDAESAALQDDTVQTKLADAICSGVKDAYDKST